MPGQGLPMDGLAVAIVAGGGPILGRTVLTEKTESAPQVLLIQAEAGKFNGVRTPQPLQSIEPTTSRFIPSHSGEFTYTCSLRPGLMGGRLTVRP